MTLLLRDQACAYCGKHAGYARGETFAYPHLTSEARRLGVSFKRERGNLLHLGCATSVARAIQRAREDNRRTNYGAY